MPNFKLNEYVCKSLYNLYLNETKNDEYIKMQIYDENNWTNCLTNINYVIKIDDGTKRRGKKSLIKYNISYDDINDTMTNFKKMGYKKFIIEPFLIFQKKCIYQYQKHCMELKYYIQKMEE